MVVKPAKACRIPSRDKNNHKLNTSNLAVHTLTIYRYIAHKRNFFAGSPKFYFIIPKEFSLSLHRAYFWSGFEPALSVMVAVVVLKRGVARCKAKQSVIITTKLVGSDQTYLRMWWCRREISANDIMQVHSERDAVHSAVLGSAVRHTANLNCLSLKVKAWRSFHDVSSYWYSITSQQTCIISMYVCVLRLNIFERDLSFFGFM